MKKARGRQSHATVLLMFTCEICTVTANHYIQQVTVNLRLQVHCIGGLQTDLVHFVQCTIALNTCTVSSPKGRYTAGYQLSQAAFEIMGS
jgi:hypothetical protein